MLTENMKIYEQAKTVPQEAKKPIGGGRLKGMTDINPMWRIKKLTEIFGPVGFGWYYDILKEWIEEGSNGEKSAFVKIHLFVKYEGEWSKPITGIGGNSFIAKEKNGLYTSDECFKMALTDAISISCKALGFGADVYYEKDRTKYDIQPEKKSKEDTEEPKKDLKKEIQKMIVQMHGKDSYKTELKRYSAFAGKDGKEVAGVESLEKLSEGRTKATYGKVKKDYEDMQKLMSQQRQQKANQDENT